MNPLLRLHPLRGLTWDSQVIYVHMDRDFERDDFEIDPWTQPVVRDGKNHWRGSVSRQMRLRHDRIENLRPAFARSSGQHDSLLTRLFPLLGPFARVENADQCRLEASFWVDRPLVRLRNAQRIREAKDEALAALHTWLCEHAETHTDAEIAQLSLRLRGWVVRTNEEFQRTFVDVYTTRTDVYDDLKGKAGVAPIEAEIEILEAKTEALRALRLQKLRAQAAREWREDTAWPEPVRNAIVEEIDDGHAFAPRGLFLPTR